MFPKPPAFFKRPWGRLFLEPGTERVRPLSELVPRLVCAVILTNIIVAIMSGLAWTASYAHHEERAVTASQTMSRLLEANLRSTFDKIDLSLRTLTRELTAEMPSNQRSGTELQAELDGHLRLQPFIESFAALSPSGRVVASSSNIPGQLRTSFDSAVFLKLKEAPGQFAVGAPTQAEDSTEWFVTVGRRGGQVGGEPQGVVLARLRLSSIERVLTEIDRGSAGTVLLRDLDMRMITRVPAHPNAPMGRRTLSPAFQGMMLAHPDMGTRSEVSRIDGVERTFTYMRVKGYPFYVVVAYATGDFLADWYVEVGKGLLLLLVFLGGTSVFSVLLVRQWRTREAEQTETLRQERNFRRLIDAAPDALVTSDSHGLIRMANRRAEVLFGYPRELLLGNPVAMLFAERERERFLATSSELLRGQGEKFLELESNDTWALHADMSEFPVSIRLSPSTSDEGPLITADIRDISERKKAEQRIEFLAHHDVLTGLPNRMLAQQRLNAALGAAEASRARLAVVFLDLDRFKSINDSLGHATGDALLRAVGAALTCKCPPTATVSRLGGDEFMLVLPEIAGIDELSEFLTELLAAIESPTRCLGHSLVTTASAGVAIFPEHGEDFETLLQNADIALYQAKAAGRNTYRYYADSMAEQIKEHQKLATNLRIGLQQGLFSLVYQPIVDAKTRSITAVEALLRWTDPELGDVSPARFIPVAEDTGLIIPLGEWVIREACRQSAEWRMKGLAVPVAVNISGAQLSRGHLLDTLRAALLDHGLPPSALQLELTESTLIEDTAGVLETVASVKHMGLPVSIDDFGTGYSSLSYLRKFNADKVKIDQSFVRTLQTDPHDTAIVRAIIQMAHSLNLKVVAEGVETSAVFDLLLALDCDEAQGYYFSRPIPASAVAERVMEMQREQETA
jgi:diguanylate cyclase (GGDEF)-like protein/PAS domain S-box-containing protein